MAYFRALTGGGSGGGMSNLIIPTVTHNSGTEITATWGYDAECIFLMGTNNSTYRQVFLIKLDSSTNMWQTWGSLDGSSSGSGAKWYKRTVSSLFTISSVTKRSITMSGADLVLSDVCIIPLTDIPTSYTF